MLQKPNDNIYYDAVIKEHAQNHIQPNTETFHFTSTSENGNFATIFIFDAVWESNYLIDYKYKVIIFLN